MSKKMTLYLKVINIPVFIRQHNDVAKNKEYNKEKNGNKNEN